MICAASCKSELSQDTTQASPGRIRSSLTTANSFKPQTCARRFSFARLELDAAGLSLYWPWLTTGWALGDGFPSSAQPYDPCGPCGAGRAPLGQTYPRLCGSDISAKIFRNSPMSIAWTKVQRLVRPRISYSTQLKAQQHTQRSWSS